MWLSIYIRWNAAVNGAGPCSKSREVLPECGSENKKGRMGYVSSGPGVCRMSWSEPTPPSLKWSIGLGECDCGLSATSPADSMQVSYCQGRCAINTISAARGKEPLFLRDPMCRQDYFVSLSKPPIESL